MYSYLIKENGYTIGRTTGKYNAFKFIQTMLNQRQELGLWFGMKCVVRDEPKTIKEYTIEKTND